MNGNVNGYHDSHSNGDSNGHSNGHPNELTINHTNGHTTSIGKTASPPCDDSPFTARVIAATGKNANPRLAEIMPALLRHLHAFAREVNLTTDEWMAGVDLINEAGQMSNDRRNETQLLCDVLGLEALVDEITFQQKDAQQSPIPGSHATPDTPSLDGANDIPVRHLSTSSAILGPFHRPEAPILLQNSSIVCPSLLASSPAYRDALTRLSGRVLSPTGALLPNALLDIWHAAPNGMYEQQDVDQPDMHLRGRFATDSSGRYALYCLRPPPYPIPDDGPAGRLLHLLDRHPFRPAHIHFVVSRPGYRTLTTQLFDSQDDYINNDAVFAVKMDLAARFEPFGDKEPDPRGAKWKVEFDFVLCETETNPGVGYSSKLEQ